VTVGRSRLSGLGFDDHEVAVSAHFGDAQYASVEQLVVEAVKARLPV
jgi:hypothetical protein